MFVGGELCSSTLVCVREAGCPEAAGTGWQLRLNLNVVGVCRGTRGIASLRTTRRHGFQVTSSFRGGVTEERARNRSEAFEGQAASSARRS